MKGEKGDTGAQGVQGQKGEDGADGKDGQDGVDGQDGEDGLSAYELFMKYYPFYQGTEKDWVDDLINDELELFTVTFKAVGEEDIVRYAFKGQAVLEVPEVPEKVGNSGVWDTTDFSNITQDMTVNAVYETIGLAYTLINNQQEYRVAAGTMNKDTEELFIPAVHEEKPVTVIAENAFRDDYEDYNFNIAHLPESITEIRNNAFGYCEQLQSIQIPSKVTTISTSAFEHCTSLMTVEMPQATTIGYSAFSGCDALTTVEMPQVTTIGSFAFTNCTSLTTVEMPQVTAIEDYAFSGCTALEHLEIPSGLTEIDSRLFDGCTSLKYVILPSGITSIGAEAFRGCTVFEAVYFKGDKQAWSDIKIAGSNSILRDAKVYYYADPMPEENEGDYWHYDVDDKTPVVWKKGN